ncbi:YoaK family protein [Xenophilus arseniciresistens]|uniref:YoaK family protein n=1 Tax=Xenophilus arseniciresistens TaxID=1283306 RepID=A0AAE3NBB3_9BURK|nr:YoaK family protein [Xenophilus arseniciresistens]MDA7418368.1 YoaK family protein [Xenophilus arseniciresistens]
MRRLRLLTGRHRQAASDRTLGLLLAFNAGALNAGGFLVLHMYTSHMTGFTSQLADALVLGNATLLLNAMGAILAFVGGAAVSAMQINWGRQHRLRHPYALPLLLEAALMLPFGLMGAITLGWHTPFAVPLTVLLLSFMMGLQNALASKLTGGRVRTTHMTGNLTDLGIELGKMLYWNRRGRASSSSTTTTAAAAPVRHNSQRLRLFGGLVLMFVAGGLAGAAGFKWLGFICVLPLAALLLALSLPPFLDDMRRSRELRERLQGLAVRLHLRPQAASHDHDKAQSAAPPASP